MNTIKCCAFLLAVCFAQPVAGHEVLNSPVAEPNNPYSCQDVWEEVGLPVSHKDHTGLLSETVMAGLHDTPLVNTVCYNNYISQYNSITKNPDWVIECLTCNVVEGGFTRPPLKFHPDPNLPEGTHSAVDREYTNSKLARGH